MRKLTTAPMIEVKAAQATFKLPMEGFASGDRGARPASERSRDRHPIRSPRPKGSPPPRSRTARFRRACPPAEARRSAAAPRKAPVAKIEPARLRRRRACHRGHWRRIAGGADISDGSGRQGALRLEALVVKPAKPEGRLPVALITHGKNAKAADNQARARRHDVATGTRSRRPRLARRSGNAGAAMASRRNPRRIPGRRLHVVREWRSGPRIRRRGR